MRLGELRTALKDKDNKLFIKLSSYEDIKWDPNNYDLELDIVVDNNIFLRVVKNEDWFWRFS